MIIPFIPNTAPFTLEQRAWLNGYFVGLLSEAHGTGKETDPAAKLERLLVGFGSQSGTAEGIAKKIAKEASAHGFTAQTRELNAISLNELTGLKRFVIVTSTWGDGEPPDNAVEFWKALNSESATRLENLSFAVLALGDRNYPEFCGAGRKIDERLEALGAARLLGRADCDVDYEAPAGKWIVELWQALGNGAPADSSKPTVAAKPIAAATSHRKWSRQNPFPARLIANRVLNGAGSSKETRHIELELAGSGLSYEPGDALGVLPRNCEELVTELIRLGGWDPNATVVTSDSSELPLCLALLTKCDLRKPTSALLDALAKSEGCEIFCELLTPEKKPVLTEYLAQREVIDLLLEFPAFRPGPAELVGMLGKLQPRLYSISSSLRAFPTQVHLTVGIVRYETLGRKRKGLCSTFLADRANETVPVFVQPSHGFKLPKDPATPIIMVGPGTGIAPFRAFLHERRTSGAPGKNWLFFGDQQSSCDFLYKEELAALRAEGCLSRLDTAFSRDQAAKVYVQNRMIENADELWKWLEAGAHFYVCGDARRMAKDVDAALHKVVGLAGHSPDQAAEYVKGLKERKRYQRDVY